MTPIAIVTRVLFVEAGLVALTLIAVFGHALWYRRRSASRARLLVAGREPLLDALASGDAARAHGVLRTMPRRVLVRLFADIAPSLVGPRRDTITDLAGRLGLTSFATRSLRSRLWWRRLQGARLLTLVGRDVRPLEGLEYDPHPLVRAQRAVAIGRHTARDGAEELLGLLGDEDGTVRFAARDALMRLGTIAQEPIGRRLAEPAPANLMDLLDIATAIPSPSYLSAALAHSADESPRVRACAAKLLRAIGGGPAIDRLVALLGDADPLVRATAASSLGVLGHWPAAAAIGRLLDDHDWDVRLSAAVALQRLAAPGELLLRRARDGQAIAAANVARQVLDIADRLRVAAAS